MGLTETLIFYLVVGIGVAVAVLLADDQASSGELVFRISSSVFFWPLYVPILLQRPPASSQTSQTEMTEPAPRDEMVASIHQVEAELESALKSLDGWAECVLARDDYRFSELRAAWHLQADRIRELDALLAQPEFLLDTQSDEENRSASMEKLKQTSEARIRHT